MGPNSREAICDVLGHLIDEAQIQRELIRKELGEIRSLLQVRGEEESDAQIRLEERVSKLERRVTL